MTEMTARDHVQAAQNCIRRLENGGLGSPAGPWATLVHAHLRAAEVIGQLERIEQEARPVVEVGLPGPDDRPQAESPAPCPTCLSADHGAGLSRAQWIAHHDEFYATSRDFGSGKSQAVDYADSRMQERFGSEPMPPDPRDGTNG